MPTAVTLDLEGVTLQGELDDSPAARALAARLPLSLSLSRWGEEYYGDVGEPLGAFEGLQVEEMAVGVGLLGAGQRPVPVLRTHPGQPGG